MAHDPLRVIGYYRSRLYDAKSLLDAINPANFDSDALLRFQLILIKNIIDAEARIKLQQSKFKILKSSLKRGGRPKAESQRIRKQVIFCENQIEGYRTLLYIWRCFGDGIANKFISKWNLKRFLFEHDSFQTKQSAGHFSGKEGLSAELKLLEDALKNGVPAVLCDLTNILRHGDICLLGDSDPVVIEVKSSENSNKRTLRQAIAIEAIQNYLKNDSGPIAGLDNVKRTALTVQEVHHNSEINDVCRSAITGVYASATPEPGLKYIAVPMDGPAPDFDSLLAEIKAPFCFFLNQSKTQRAWGNYYPFTLSLSDPESLYQFIRGNIYLIVVICIEQLANSARLYGMEVEAIFRSDISLKLKDLHNSESQAPSIGVSEHFFGRLGHEFLSLDWFLRHDRTLLDQLKQQTLNDESHDKNA